LGKFQVVLEYEGCRYLGSQIQSCGSTIEGEIVKSLKKSGFDYSNLIFSSRTDSGVHSSGQVFTVVIENPVATVAVQNALNALLPFDIRVTDVSVSDFQFHPRGSARFREYNYWFTTDLIPMSYHGKLSRVSSIDLEVFGQLTHLVLGIHDFSAFRNAGSGEKSRRKLVVRSSIEIVDEVSSRFNCRLKLLKYVIVSDSFLYRMVRNLVGAMLDCSRGKFPLRVFSEMLETGNRTIPYTSAKADGLVLTKVYY